MNKKESAEMQALKDQIIRLQAWKLTDKVDRDLPPPAHGSNGLTRGWDFNDYSNSVFKVCSSSIHHGHGWEKTSSQDPRHLFSTEELAYRALRYAVEQKSLDAMSKIDAAIASLA
jgi:hypothetical protein